mmetsp:Transcript_47372/g.92404  ORF Transcript_47372/g.92404 Transcript_47372/m.92404 type:complete len:235 (+) Transcript_47372:107-811(+)
MRLLRILCFFSLMTATKVVADEVDLEEEVARETIAAGRGERETIGVRDQWASTDHLGEVFDSRKPISAKARHLLREYRLECAGCDHYEATARINAFVRMTRRRARNRKWLRHASILIMVFVGTVFLFKAIAAETSAQRAVDDQIRREIEDMRRRADTEEMNQRIAAKRAPTWREIEEKEVWTPKQEKQFAKALVEFGGIPAKERYGFIADNVKDKSRQECLMHHKLLEAITKDQ